jgi:4-amino-4-deoxy-L-arabinose transferase-like glycosyltransferase
MIFIFFFIILVFIIPLFFINTIGVSDDEAAYLVVGKQISNGSILYRDVADVKFPGTYYFGAIINTIFGKSITAARTLVSIFHAASAILIFFLGKRIKDKKVGMTASIFFLIAAYIPIFQGYFFKAEPFAVFFLLLSVIFFFKHDHLNNFLAGIFLGLGVLFKQTAILLFGVYFLFYLLKLRYKENRTKKYFLNSTKTLIMIFLGISVTIIPVFLYFFLMGAAEEMIYYSVYFLSFYQLPFLLEFKINLWINGFFSYLPVWLLFLSMLLFVFYNFIREKKSDEKNLFLGLWAIVLLYPAITIILNQRVFFAIPAISLLSAIIFQQIYQKLKKPSFSKKLKLTIVTLLILTTGIATALNITLYGSFIEASNVEDQIQNYNEIKQYINGKVHIFPNDNVLFFFSNFTPDVTYLGLVFNEDMAEQVVTDLKENNVTYIVGEKDFINKIEKKEIQESNPRIIIYDYIKINYIVSVETNTSFIYKIN